MAPDKTDAELEELFEVEYQREHGFTEVPPRP